MSSPTNSMLECNMVDRCLKEDIVLFQNKLGVVHTRNYKTQGGGKLGGSQGSRLAWAM